MDKELSTMWESFLKELEKKSMSQVTYSTWFSRMLPKSIDYDEEKIHNHSSLSLYKRLSCK